MKTKGEALDLLRKHEGIVLTKAENKYGVCGDGFHSTGWCWFDTFVFKTEHIKHTVKNKVRKKTSVDQEQVQDIQEFLNWGLRNQTFLTVTYYAKQPFKREDWHVPQSPLNEFRGFESDSD